jgi:hypothetical protein
MLFRVHVGYLADVVADAVEQTAADIFWTELLLRPPFSKDLAEAACNSRGLEPDLGVVGPVFRN